MRAMPDQDDALGFIDPEELLRDSETVDVEETDLDGDGTVDLVTTTTRRHNALLFGPGVRSSGWVKTEVEVSQCDEDHDGHNDWVAVTATERIHVDLDGDGTVDLVSTTERVSHDFDGDGVPDLVTTKISEKVGVDDERTGRREIVTSSYERTDEPSAGFDPLRTDNLISRDAGEVSERTREALKKLIPYSDSDE